MKKHEIINFSKNRPDDFILELEHIEKSFIKGSNPSPISFEKVVILLL